MELKVKRKILYIYPEYKNVYGPYKRKDGRKILVLYDGEKDSQSGYVPTVLKNLTEIHTYRI